MSTEAIAYLITISSSSIDSPVTHARLACSLPYTWAILPHSFVDFVKGEEIYLLIELLCVLKEDLYRRQINDFIARFWINIETLVS